MGGTAKKNLRVFREICGDKNLGHVRIVTTNWNLVDEKQGNSRQVALAEGAFKPLTDARAKLCRHDKGLESALSIMSQLIHQEPVTMKIQEELNAGRSMGDTSAGAVIVEEMEEMKKKHNKELEVLKKELEDASMANDEELRTELIEERQRMEVTISRAEEARKTLTNHNLNPLRREQPGERVVASPVPSVPTHPLPQQQRQGNDVRDLQSGLTQIVEGIKVVVGAGQRFVGAQVQQHFTSGIH